MRTGEKVSSISIHVPRERDDPQPLGNNSPLRISIHVPRERDDLDALPVDVDELYFNPRPS